MILKAGMAASAAALMLFVLVPNEAEAQRRGGGGGGGNRSFSPPRNFSAPRSNPAPRFSAPRSNPAPRITQPRIVPRNNPQPRFTQPKRNPIAPPVARNPQFKGPPIAKNPVVPKGPPIAKGPPIQKGPPPIAKGPPLNPKGPLPGSKGPGPIVKGPPGNFGPKGGPVPTGPFGQNQNRPGTIGPRPGFSKGGLALGAAGGALAGYAAYKGAQRLHGPALRPGGQHINVHKPLTPIASGPKGPGRIGVPHGQVPKVTLRSPPQHFHHRFHPFVQRSWKRPFLWAFVATLGWLTVPEYIYPRFREYCEGGHWDEAVGTLSQAYVEEECSGGCEPYVHRYTQLPATVPVRATLPLAPPHEVVEVCKLENFVNREWSQPHVAVEVPTVGMVTMPERSYGEFTALVNQSPPQYGAACQMLQEQAAADTVQTAAGDMQPEAAQSE